ncbi:hypothetical protein [Phytoactinopolyspora halotolerans]|uniref:LPXTG cell wall anchor domain-containing protein n=1 Tax=Phytoactinopolyspora halotolerans TaxID=1981512 RepID=A0A6L9S279_9ACTN|nr:hypothetical protein [Phytoactinopolyspora halotolerans]NED99116.1 hypothetical protein [Phytoactinopolyspora halotolerans]
MPTPTMRTPRALALRRHMHRRPSRRTVLTSTAAISLAAAGALSLPAVATATTTATGPDGQTVTVSKSDGLDPDGETITVNGSGFDLNKGVYVVLCVDNGAGQQPTPCLGGADMEGGGGTSAWISSNPPSYGEGLAQPFEEVNGTGSFSVELHVAARDEFTDCLDPSAAPDGCVVGTRADHTRTADRSADVLVPVTFAGSGASDDESGGTDTGDDGSDAQGAQGAGGGAGDNAGSDDGPASANGTGTTGDDGATGDNATTEKAADAADDLAATGKPVTTGVALATVLLAAGTGAFVAGRHRTAPSAPTREN